MIIELKALLTPNDPPLAHLRGAEEQIKESPEWRVREHFFLSSVRFQVGELVLSRHREPVLDFGLSLRSILDELALRSHAELSFQGSSDRIRFTLTEDRVEIRSNYARGVADCSYVDLCRAVLIFVRDSLDALTAAAPQLLENRFIEYLYRQFLVREMGDDQFKRYSRVIAEIHRAGEN